MKTIPTTPRSAGRIRRGGVAIAVAAALSATSCSREFKDREQAVRAEWIQMQSELRQRNDLVPHVVAALTPDVPDARKAAETLSAAHDQFAVAQTREEAISAANKQSTAFQDLKAIVDSHPDLKTKDALGAALQDLSAAETRIAIERMRYNAQVQQFRTSRSTILGTLTYYAMRSDDYPFYIPPIQPGSGKPVAPDFDVDEPLIR